MFNDSNPNLHSMRRNPNSHGLSKFVENIYEVAQSRKTIEDDVYKRMMVWLQQPVFLETGDRTISITFLQVTFLVVELDQSMTFVRQWPLQFITDAISRLARDTIEEPLQFCETKLILMIVHFMVKSQQPTSEQFKFLYDSIYKETLLDVLAKREKRNALTDYAWFILAYLRTQFQSESRPASKDPHMD